MSRVPFNPITPHPMFRRQTEDINRALRQASTLGSLTSNDASIAPGPLGTTLSVNPTIPRDFWFYGVLVNNSPDGTYGDFNDSRYWVQSISPTQVALAIPTDAARPYSDAQFHVVANHLAESIAGTHMLPTTAVSATAGLAIAAGATLVRVYTVDGSKVSAGPGDNGNTMYVCEVIGGASTSLFKITGAASGGGKYNARSVTGGSTAVATGTLAMPEGGTVASADDTLFLNLAENGSSGHALAVDGTTFVVALRTGITNAGLIIAEANVGGAGGGTVPPGTLFAVDLSSPSAASGGDSTTACAITYTVTDKLGNVLLTGASPECPRGIGLRLAATKGTAYYDADNNPVLFWANEPESASVPGCGEP